MKKILLLSSAISCYTILPAQNVGIGTNIPATNLHVLSTSASIIRIESSAGINEAGVELKTNGGVNDVLEIRKWPNASAGNIAGIPLSGLSVISTGTASSGLIIYTKNAMPLYFATNNTERMRIDPSGAISIGNVGSFTQKVNINGATQNGLYVSSDNQPAAGIGNAVTGELTLNSAGGSGIGVFGRTKNAVASSAGILAGNYGVVGTAIDQGYGIGAFATAGAGGIFSYVFAGAGKALKTYGDIQLQNIGEAAGKVLTSDASGNATWQLFSTAHDHFGETWSGATTAVNQSGLTVVNNTIVNRSSGIKGMQTASSGNFSSGVLGSSNSAFGVGVWGFSAGAGGPFTNPLPQSGVSGVASGLGTGVYGTSYSGIGIYGNSGDSTAVYGVNGGINGNAGYFNLTNAASTSAALKVKAAGNTALELNNGYIKVSGANKTAFSVAATAANSSNHILNLSYPNQASTDILLVTHTFNSPSGINNYLTAPFSVYWNGTIWTIYLDDFSAILNKSFNVLVIKQ